MVSETALTKTTVGTLLGEVSAAFADSFTLPDDFLVHAYNHAAETLALLDPAADGKKTVTAANGVITTGLARCCPTSRSMRRTRTAPLRSRRAATIRCTSARCQPP